jgi:hypothetical protein
MDAKRRVGRPPLDGRTKSVPVTFSLPPKRFDELCADAQRQRLTLTALLRRLVARRPSF